MLGKNTVKKPSARYHQYPVYQVLFLLILSYSIFIELLSVFLLHLFDNNKRLFSTFRFSSTSIRVTTPKTRSTEVRPTPWPTSRSAAPRWWRRKLWTRSASKCRCAKTFSITSFDSPKRPDSKTSRQRFVVTSKRGSETERETVRLKQISFLKFFFFINYFTGFYGAIWHKFNTLKFLNIYLNYIT